MPEDASSPTVVSCARDTVITVVAVRTTFRINVTCSVVWVLNMAILSNMSIISEPVKCIIWKRQKELSCV